MPDHVMNYIETEAPSHLTLVQWRRSRSGARSRRRSLGSLMPTRRVPTPAF